MTADTMRLFLATLIICFSVGCSGPSGGPAKAIDSNKNKPVKSPVTALPVTGYEIVKSYPHDPKAFTQGLVFNGGFLYESTGQYGESSLRKVELATGKILKEHDLSTDYFGEGMTILGDKVYQITWRERTAFVYGLEDFKLERELRYSGDGWGLTNDGTNLVMSDGTHVIRFANPENFQTVKTIVVMREDGKPLMNLNELEYINGEIWANIWHSERSDILGKSNYIARIDPSNGKLLGWIDLGGISPEDQRRDSENTLNGIAYDAESQRIFVTGKNWRKVFEIKLVPPPTK